VISSFCCDVTSSLFSDVNERRLVGCYRCFETTYRPILKSQAVLEQLGLWRSDRQVVPKLRCLTYKKCKDLMARRCLIKLISTKFCEDPFCSSRVVKRVRRCSVGVEVRPPKPTSEFQTDFQQSSQFSGDRIQHKLDTEQPLWPTIRTG
jgi:hypothetical protein